VWKVVAHNILPVFSPFLSIEISAHKIAKNTCAELASII